MKPKESMRVSLLLKPINVVRSYLVNKNQSQGGILKEKNLVHPIIYESAKDIIKIKPIMDFA